MRNEKREKLVETMKQQVVKDRQAVYEEMQKAYAENREDFIYLAKELDKMDRLKGLLRDYNMIMVNFEYKYGTVE